MKDNDHPQLQSSSRNIDDPGRIIHELTGRLGFYPANSDLFIEAITHSSFANENNLSSNERLEFLGDSVLSLIVCRYLYCSYPTSQEGELAKLKSVIVSTPVLAGLAKKLNLNQYVRLGQGELRTNGRDKQNILADLFEAFTGAFFLSFGFEKTYDFMLPFIEAVIPEINHQCDYVDAKSALQEITQTQGVKPEYRTIQEEGPPHNRIFTVEVLLNGAVLGMGTGRSLKEAQNKAAGTAIRQLKTIK